MSLPNTLASPSKIRVVIAERFQQVQEEMQQHLDPEQDIVVIGVAHNGQEVVYMAVNLQPDVVLMDTNLLEMDGVTTTQRIVEQIPSVAVMLTSYTDRDMPRAMMAGAKDYLVKPFSHDELIHRIRQLCHRRKK